MHRAKTILYALAAILTAALAQDGLAAEAPMAPEPTSTAPQLIVDPKGLSGEKIVSVDISSDGKHVAAASGKEVRVWSLETGRQTATLRGYREPGGFDIGTINVIKFIPGSSYLAVAVTDNTEEGSTRIYDLNRPDELHQLVAGHAGCTKGLAVNAAGDRMATYGCDFNFYVYKRDPATGTWVVDYKSGVEEAGWNQYVTLRDDPHHTPLSELFYFDFVQGDWFLATSSGAVSNPNNAVEYTPANAGLLLLNARNRRPITDFRNWPEPLHPRIHQLHRMKDPYEDEGMTVTRTAQTLIADKAPWYVTAGKARRGGGKTEYWAAAYYGEGPRDFRIYDGHRFNPSSTALWHSTDPGRPSLAVSGDELGEVHVWDANSGLQVARFAPLNWQLYGVQWGEDGKSVEFSTHPYAQSDYNYNHMGPTTHTFDLESRHLSLAPPDLSVSTDGARLTVGDGPSRMEIGVRNGHLVRFVGDRWEYLSPRGWQPQLKSVLKKIDTGPPAANNPYLDVVPAPQWPDDLKFGEVYSFVAAPTERDEDPRVIVGSDAGKLEEFKITRPNPAEPPVILCTRKFIGHTARVTGLNISEDGRALVSCSWDGTIRMWNLEEVKVTGDVDFFADGTRVTSVPVDSSAKRAGIEVGDVITHFDGKPFFERQHAMAQGNHLPGDQVTIDYLPANGAAEQPTPAPVRTDLQLAEGPSYHEPYLTLFTTRDGEWVMFTPGGYFDASLGGEQYVGWHINRERHQTALFHGVKQFEKSLYRPKVVSAALAECSEAMAVQLANQQSTLPALPHPDVTSAPSVVFKSPLSPLRTTTGEVAYELVATTSELDPIERVEVHVGIRSAPEKLELIGSQKNSGIETLRYRGAAQITPKDTEIFATAYTSAASSKAARLEVRWDTPDKKAALKPRLFVLAIGISEYDLEGIRLEWAAKDARDFAAAWKKQEGRFYSEVHTHVVTDSDATRANINNGMKWLTEVSDGKRGSDTVMLFLAGHGLYDREGIWYFGGKELKPDDLWNTAIPQTDFQALLDYRLKGCNTFLFVDTCHAAGVAAIPNPDQTLFGGMSLGRIFECVCMLACEKEQQSVENERWQNGAFTKSLVAALNSPQADTQVDKIITFDELFTFVNAETARLANQVNVVQTPTRLIPRAVSTIAIGAAAE